MLAAQPAELAKMRAAFGQVVLHRDRLSDEGDGLGRQLNTAATRLDRQLDALDRLEATTWTQEITRSVMAMQVAVNRYRASPNPQAAERARGLVRQARAEIDKAPPGIPTVTAIQAEHGIYAKAVDGLAESLEAMTAAEQIIDQIFDRIHAAIDTLSSDVQRAANEMETVSAATKREMTRNIYFLVGAAGALTLALGLLIGGGMSRALAGLRAAMTRIAEGDTVTPIAEVERRTEIGQMASTVEVFRENAAKVARMSAEEQVSGWRRPSGIAAR